MPPNPRKPQPDLAKPSEGASSSAGNKPSESTNPLQGLNITAQQELGSAGGIKATGKLTVGVDNLIGQQGIDIEIDATNRTAGFGAGIGSTKGKLGVNIGGTVGYDEEGKISIKGAEAGINIGGFGGSASIDEDEGIRGSISVAGAKVEIGIAPDGKKSVSLCYGVPGGELCVTFEPDPGILLPDAGTSTASNNIYEPVILPTGSNNFCRLVLNLQKYWRRGLDIYSTTGSEVEIKTTIKADYNKTYPTFYESTKYTSWYYDSITNQRTGIAPYTYAYSDRPASFRDRFYKPAGYNINIANAYHEGKGEYAWAIEGREWEIYAYINNVMNKPWNSLTGGFQFWSDTNIGINKFTISDGICSLPDGKKGPLSSTALPSGKLQLPNYPQHFKPMNCCDKVEEIYKYLGIAKLKKQKMKLAKALMVPKGQGNEQLEDYYEIMESLFRVMANGGIFNPISKPLGVEYQNVNATSWASEVYEMIAEAKSNGDSTQRFEMLASFQLVQMMKILAEQRRMIECLSEAIGITPDLSTEEVPVMFTIHEAHKGFDKKQPKEIDISKAKTDDQVEAVLSKVFKPSKIPITKWVFNPNHISISEAINKL